MQIGESFQAATEQKLSKQQLGRSFPQLLDRSFQSSYMYWTEALQVAFGQKFSKQLLGRSFSSSYWAEAFQFNSIQYSIQFFQSAIKQKLSNDEQKLSKPLLGRIFPTSYWAEAFQATIGQTHSKQAIGQKLAKQLLGRSFPSRY